MKIFVSKQCESISGTIGRGFGYNIQRRKNGFFVKRNPNGPVPPDGHWRFILACATLAHQRLHITDIRVSQDEVRAALLEAGHHTAMWNLKLKIYDARDIINLQITFGL